MTKATQREVKMVPFNAIFVDPQQNSRRKLTNIPDLAKSIQESDGLMTPVAVTNGGDGKQPYTLAAGYRRMAALHHLDWGSKPIPVIVVDNAVEANLIENVRDDLPALDLAARLSEMVSGTYPVPEGVEAKQYDKKELAAKMGCSAQHVGNLLRIHEQICDDVKKLLRGENAPARFLVAIMAKSADKQLELAKAWLKDQEALAKSGRKRRARSAGGKGGGGGEGEDAGFIRPTKVVDEKRDGDGNLVHKRTVADYYQALKVKVDAANKEDALKLQGAIEATEFFLGKRKRFPGLVEADFKVLEQEEEEETEEATEE